MTVLKASKRNLRKKLSQYTKKAKLTNLTIKKEITSTLDIGNDKTTPTLNIGDDKDDENNKDNLSYVYNPNKVS